MSKCCLPLLVPGGGAVAITESDEVVTTGRWLMDSNTANKNGGDIFVPDCHRSIWMLSDILQASM